MRKSRTRLGFVAMYEVRWQSEAGLEKVAADRDRTQMLSSKRT